MSECDVSLNPFDGCNKYFFLKLVLAFDITVMVIFPFIMMEIRNYTHNVYSNVLIPVILILLGSYKAMMIVRIEKGIECMKKKT